MKPYTELAKTERLDLLFPVLDGLHVLDRHRSSVRNSRTEARRRRPVPCRQTSQPGQFSDLRLGELRIRERRCYGVLPGRVLARAIISQIIQIHAVHDVLVPALPPDLLEAREQLVLAMKAAVGIVPQVVGI